MAKSILFDLTTEKLQTLDIKDANELKTIYEHLNCDIITIPRYLIGGRLYDIIADDEGLLKDDPIPSLFLDDEPALCGSFIITKYDDQTGDQIGLSEDDIHHLNYYLRFIEYRRRELDADEFIDPDPRTAINARTTSAELDDLDDD